MKKGFTLIELLVVISVIGILAAFAIASFSSVQSRGRDAKRKADLNALQKALEIAKNDSNGSSFYPACLSNGDVCTIGDISTPDTTWNPQLTPTYIKVLPKDPKNTESNVYRYLPSSALANCTGKDGGNPCTNYSIVACLENQNDPQIDTTPNIIICPAAENHPSYSVTNP